MEGRVTVNDDSDSSWSRHPESSRSTPPVAPAGETEWLPEGQSDVPDDAEAPELADDPELAEALEEPPGASYGPCLYLGRSGERCSKPALRGGFCAKHHPDEDRRWPGRDYRRVLLAGIALVVILWPYLEDAVQFALRMVRELRAN